MCFAIDERKRIPKCPSRAPRSRHPTSRFRVDVLEIREIGEQSAMGVRLCAVHWRPANAFSIPLPPPSSAWGNDLLGERAPPHHCPSVDLVWGFLRCRCSSAAFLPQPLPSAGPSVGSVKGSSVQCRVNGGQTRRPKVSRASRRKRDPSVPQSHKFTPVYANVYVIYITFTRANENFPVANFRCGSYCRLRKFLWPDMRFSTKRFFARRFKCVCFNRFTEPWGRFCEFYLMKL